MKRPRLRRVLKWCGAVVCSLLLAGFLATMRWSHIAINFPRTSIGVTGGALYVEWRLMLESPGSPRFEVGPSQGWNIGVADWIGYYGFIPRWGAGGSSRYATCPLWIPFVAIGLPTVWLCYHDRRRPAPGTCRCGYNLTGNTSGRCPECGQVLAARQ